MKLNYRLVKLVPVAALIFAAASCSNPTADKTAAKMSAPVQPAPAPASAAPAPSTASGGALAAPVHASPAPAGKNYEFSNNGSSIDFTGYKVTGSHVGGFGKFTGTATMPGDDPTKLHVKVDIDMNSTYSDAPDLTKTMKGDGFFEVAKYPTATFESTSVAKSDKGYDVTGNLTLHGVTKGITFPATIEVSGDTLKTKAEFTIQRTEWGVNYKGVADDLIREDVLLYFDVVAKAK